MLLANNQEMNMIITARMYSRMSKKQQRDYKQGICNNHKMASPQFDQLMNRATLKLARWDARPKWKKIVSWSYYKLFWRMSSWT